MGIGTMDEDEVDGDEQGDAKGKQAGQPEGATCPLLALDAHVVFKRVVFHLRVRLHRMLVAKGAFAAFAQADAEVADTTVGNLVAAFEGALHRHDRQVARGLAQLNLAARVHLRGYVYHLSFLELGLLAVSGEGPLVDTEFQGKIGNFHSHFFVVRRTRHFKIEVFGQPASKRCALLQQSLSLLLNQRRRA